MLRRTIVALGPVLLLASLQWFPFIIQFMTQGANAGGINVMTYDLSDNESFHECPTDDTCTLLEQV